jgi:hypothetical protein
VLPTPNNTPSPPLKKGIDMQVPLDILLDLIGPKIRIGFWLLPMDRASVPKTAVDENNKLSPDKRQIGFAWQVGMQSISNTFGPKSLA